MQVSATRGTSGYGSAQEVATVTSNKQTLSQEDFLKLLVAQLGSQDPLNPMNDTEFVSQMAEFSSLELAQGTQKEVAGLRSEQQLAQANALLGRNVQIEVSPGVLVAGTVTGVVINNGTPQVVVGDQAYSLGQLVAVSAPQLVKN